MEYIIGPIILLVIILGVIISCIYIKENQIIIHSHTDVTITSKTMFGERMYSLYRRHDGLWYDVSHDVIISRALSEELDSLVKERLNK